VPEATFYYDFSSPYSYLAAQRIGELLPEATWRPISFGFVLRHVGRVPWSLQPGREADMEVIAERAAARGLPPVRYPEGWPAESYSLAPLRAALFAEQRGRLEEFTHAAFRVMFAEGRALGEEGAIRDAAAEAGLDPDEVEGALERDDVKQGLRAYTDEAIDRGVTGVPTVAVGEHVFWGDDRLEDAAAAAGARPRSSP
jgi:2-hydroxychromene-2-carboxylate isomerase